MHHFILPTQDSWISSGSSTITGESFTNQNHGFDEILQINKVFQNNLFDYQTRVLVNFAGTDFSSMSQSISSGEIPSDAKFCLRLYEAEGNSELSEEYTLSAHPLWKSWSEGTGKSTDNPKNINGISWDNRDNRDNITAVSWSYRDGVRQLGVAGDEDLNGIEFNEYHVTFTNAGQAFGSVTGSNFLSADNDDKGGVWIERKGYIASQSFSLQSPDVNMDVTDMVNKWVDSSISNYGMILKFSGSQETDSKTFGNLRFFSKESSTIFLPKLEVKWDNHLPCTGSNTGSLNELTMSGDVDNYLEMRNLRKSYRQGERIKFRITARKRYIEKSISTSFQTLTDSFISEGSGSYAIKDVSTNEFIIPFSDDYTLLSCDNSGPYFIQWLDGFHEDRNYKILLKLKTNDKHEQIFDNNFIFNVKGVV